MSNNDEFPKPFDLEELNTAINEMKIGKAPGLDKMFTEFFKHFGLSARNWLVSFFNEISSQNKLPKFFKRAKVISVAKPGKDGTDASHFRPISLSSITLKIVKRLILNRIQPKINQIVPTQQASFRPHRSCGEQVLALTTHIEKGFQIRKKSFAMFIDLTAAYDTVWKHDLLFKLLSVIPCRKIINLIDNMFFSE